MKNTDLRVGNLVSLSGSLTLKVYEIHEDCFYAKDAKGSSFKNTWADLKPIPLTEEILLRCGFEKGCFYHTKPVDFSIKINENYYVLIYFFGSDVSCYVTNMEEYDFESEISVDIKYLHELQNLISSTNGQELKIEL